MNNIENYVFQTELVYTLVLKTNGVYNKTRTTNAATSLSHEKK
jgi:hypothetical protein